MVIIALWKELSSSVGLYRIGQEHLDGDSFLVLRGGQIEVVKGRITGNYVMMRMGLKHSLARLISIEGQGFVTAGSVALAVDIERLEGFKGKVYHSGVRIEEQADEIWKRSSLSIVHQRLLDEVDHFLNFIFIGIR